MRARPSQATVVAATLALILALAAATLAWSAPKRGIAPLEGLRPSAAGALRIADSRGEAAILRAPALAPGASVTGRLTIRNRGAAGRLVLSQHHLLETPGPAGDSLATALRLRIRDETEGSAQTVYHGALAAMPRLHLGLLPAGASRRYRFVARLSKRGFVDNGLMGAQARFDYRWQLKPARR